MNINTIYTNDQTILLNTLLSSYVAGLYVSTNTASGTNTVTLNATSGAATFTSLIPNNGIVYFTINNTYFKANQKIDPVIVYDNEEGGNGSPYITNHSLVDGQAIFQVINKGDDNNDGSPVIIQFKIAQ